MQASTAQIDTAQMNKVRANLKPETKQWHAQRADTRIEREYLWSRPSCAAMSLRLGTSYASGPGQVPV